MGFWRLMQRQGHELRRHLGSSVVVVVTLAVASGPLTAVLGLSFPHRSSVLGGMVAPAELVQLYSRFTRALATVHNPLSYPEYLDVQRETRLFAGTAAVYRSGAEMTWAHGESEAQTALVTGSYFGLLGATVQRGRPILPADDTGSTSAQPIAVLSDAYWRSKFDGDAGIVGRTMQLNGATVTIVGVAREDFTGTDVGQPVDVWVPLSAHPGFANVPPMLTARTEHVFSVIGRLRPGSSVTDAMRDIGYLGGRLDAAYPDPAGARQYSAESVALTPPPPRGGDDLGLAIWLLVALVLAVACFNIAGIFLARAVADEQQTAIRLALGSGIRRVVGDALARSFVLSTIGLAVGAVLAAWVFRIVAAHIEPGDGFSLDRWATDPIVPPTLDWRVFGACTVVAVCAATAFVLLPFLHWRKIPLADVLKIGHHSASRGVRRARDLLVVLQLALTITVVVAATTLGRTIQQLRRVDPGFSTTGLVSISLDYRFARRTAAMQAATDLEMMAEAGTVPGVTAAGIGETPLLQFDGGFVQRVRSDAPDAGVEEIQTDIVGPGYFRALGARIVDGRDFDARDGPDAPTRVLVSASLARTLWPHDSPVGRRLGLVQDDGSSKPADVIGVVSDVNTMFVGSPAKPTFYTSALQDRLLWGYLYARVNGRQAADSLRVRIAHVLGPQALPPVVRTAEENRERGMAFVKDSLLAAAMLGGIAFLVAVVGLYGTLSYMVAQRTREIGIRIAMGARRHEIGSLVVNHVLKLAGLGALTAVPLAVGVVRLMRVIVYGVEPLDPVVCGATVALLAAAMVAGALGPAVAILRVDPLTAIRSE